MPAPRLSSWISTSPTGVPFNLKGGDVDGVGHFKAKNNTGEIIYRMLTSDCTDLDCKGSYAGGPAVAD